MFSDDKNIYKTFQISLFFSKTEKIWPNLVTVCIQKPVPLDPKKRPPGSKKTSPWIQKNVPLDILTNHSLRGTFFWILGDVFLDPGGRFLGSRGTGFWIHTVTRLGHTFLFFEKNIEIWNVLYIFLSSENIPL